MTGKLGALVTLAVGRNSIRSLPGDLFSLPSLVVILAGDNRIEAVPHQILQVTRTRNPAGPPSTSDPEFGTFLSVQASPSLNRLQLDGNPLDSPPERVCMQGVGAIQAFLESPSDCGLEVPEQKGSPAWAGDSPESVSRPDPPSPWVAMDTPNR